MSCLSRPDWFGILPEKTRQREPVVRSLETGVDSTALADQSVFAVLLYSAMIQRFRIPANMLRNAEPK